MGISVVLLAVGEAENLKLLLPQIQENIEVLGLDYEIIVVDAEQSLDNTEEVCRTFEKVHYYHQRFPRYAGAFRTGIQLASKDLLLVLDADGSHTPSRIGAIYQKLQEGYDLVIGSRYCKGGKTHDSKSSLLMSKLLNFFMRLVVGVRAKDISTSFRLYHTEQVKAVDLTCKNYEVLQEVILRMKKQKPTFKIGEVPITFEKRIYGQSKRKLWQFIFTYIKTLFSFLKIRISKK